MSKTQKLAIILFVLVFSIGLSFFSTKVYAKCDPTSSSDCYTYDDSLNVYTLTDDLELTTTWTISEDTTINLAGHKIETSKNYNGDTILVQNGKTLTITGYGTITNSNNKDDYAALWNNGTVIIDGATFELNTETNNNTYYVIVNHGTMTINDATIKTNDSSSSMIENGYYDYTNKSDRKGYCEGTNQCQPTLTINDGTFSGGLNTVKNDDNGILTINGGTFTNTTQVTIFNANVVTINGGTFEVPEGQACIATGSCGQDSNDKGIVTINGGSYISSYLFGLCSWATCTSQIEIRGGTFNYTVGIFSDSCEDMIDLTVTGGTYSTTDIIPEYDEDIYMLLDNEDGTYSVVAIKDYPDDQYVITQNEDGSVSVELIVTEETEDPEETQLESQVEGIVEDEKDETPATGTGIYMETLSAAVVACAIVGLAITKKYNK